MKHCTLLWITTILFSISISAQSKKDSIIIVQKFYYDTLETNYRKVKFQIDSKAERVKKMDYYSAHTNDTTQVKRTIEYAYENGRYLSLKYRNRNKKENIEKYKIGDTLFEREINYSLNDTAITIIKKIYNDDGIFYAARLFPKRQSSPYNERNYIYDKKGRLTEIQENYNDENTIKYKTIFDYKDGILSRMTEYKKVENRWEKQITWGYILLTDSHLKNKIKRRVNSLLLDSQFKELPW